MPYTEQLDEAFSKHAGKFLPSREFAAPQVPPLHIMTVTKELIEELVCVRISLSPGYCHHWHLSILCTSNGRFTRL